jgi:hypothetical protein
LAAPLSHLKRIFELVACLLILRRVRFEHFLSFLAELSTVTAAGRAGPGSAGSLTAGCWPRTCVPPASEVTR